MHALAVQLTGSTPRNRADEVPRRRFRLETKWAIHTDELREAQRLRYRVFALELGARLSVPPGTPKGHDVDRFDDHCAHLLVRAVPLGEGTAKVVGTYRVLTPTAARAAGGCYSDTEFDMTPLRALRPRMAELGRTCIDAEWRNGGTLLALWSSLGEFMLQHRLDAFFGCASIRVQDGGHRAASLWRRLSEHHRAPPERRVSPLRPLPLHELQNALDVVTPPLIKGYLNCGAELLGPPAWDPDFGSADLPMLMQSADLPKRYRRHFLDAPADRRHSPLNGRTVAPIDAGCGLLREETA